MNKLLGLVIVALALGACTPSPTVAPPPAKVSNPAPEAIEVGAGIPLTGPQTANGNQLKVGYDFAVEDINKDGGIFVKDYGKKIPLRLTILDDESVATKRVSQLEGLLAQRQIVAYLGGSNADAATAISATVEKNKIAHLEAPFILWKIHQQGYKYLFSPFPKTTDIARDVFQALNDYLPEGQRPTKVAIFQETSEFGIEMGGACKDNAQTSGYTVVTYEQYTPGAKDVSDMIGKAKAAGAEMVLAFPVPPDGQTIIKQMVSLDFNPKIIYFLRAADAPSWNTDMGKLGESVLITPGWNYALNYPGVKELNAKHQAKLGRPADPLVGPAYATVQILAAAIEKAGTLDRDKIRDAIAATDMYTVQGHIRFRTDGTAVLKSPMNQWQNGKAELVWPKEFATAPLVYPAPMWAERK